ncbi:hypothetical protein GCM10020331_075450 [Ectobacillus funiculus]
MDKDQCWEGKNLVIMKGSQHPSAAWQFVKWMVSKEPQELMLKSGLIPINKEIDFKNLLEIIPTIRRISME